MLHEKSLVALQWLPGSQAELCTDGLRHDAVPVRRDVVGGKIPASGVGSEGGGVVYAGCVGHGSGLRVCEDTRPQTQKENKRFHLHVMITLFSLVCAPKIRHSAVLHPQFGFFKCFRGRRRERKVTQFHFYSGVLEIIIIFA